MFNIRYGIKFIAEHVVFMSIADTTNDVMHFVLNVEWDNEDKTNMKEANEESEQKIARVPNMTFYLLLRSYASIYFYSR